MFTGIAEMKIKYLTVITRYIVTNVIKIHIILWVEAPYHKSALPLLRFQILRKWKYNDFIMLPGMMEPHY